MYEVDDTKEYWEYYHFEWKDYSIVILMIMSTIAIGFQTSYFSDEKYSLRGMAHANRTLGVFPLSFSIFNGFFSAISLLGIPSDVYKYGTSHTSVVFAYILVIPVTAIHILPIFYNLNIISIYEYLEMRFNKRVRILGSTIFLAQSCVYMAVVATAPGVALRKVTGINEVFSSIILLSVCIFYATLGGLKAIAWSDTFHGFLVIGSLMSMIVIGISKNPAETWDRIVNSDRIDFFNFDLDLTVKYTFWTQSIGGFFRWMTYYGFGQVLVQRYLSSRTLKAARLALGLSLIGIILLTVLSSIVGLLMYAYFWRCDPIVSGRISQNNELLPYYLIKSMSPIPGFPGLFMCAIFSASLSTLSSVLNSAAICMVVDFILPIYPEMSEEKSVVMVKTITVVFGLIYACMIIVLGNLKSLANSAFGFFGMMEGSVLGLFILGIFIPWANSTGALVGGLCSLITILTIGFGTIINASNEQPSETTKTMSTAGCNYTTILPPSWTEVESFVLFKLSYMWYGALSSSIAVIIGFIVSLLRKPKNPRTLNPDLMCRCLVRLSKCLPNVVRKPLQFPIGRDWEEPVQIEDPLKDKFVTPISHRKGSNIKIIHTDKENDYIAKQNRFQDFN